MIEDSYGRVIDYLRISVTDRCNLRCVYCMPEGGISLFPHSEILSYEEIIYLTKILSELGIRKIRITGGEPLIRKNISYLIERIHRIEKVEDIALTTNGILLPKMAFELKEAGLKRVNISLDTLKEEKFSLITRKNDFKRVISAIDKSIEVGFNPIKLNVVVIKGVNDDEILDFVKFVEDKDISVRFIEFMPWGRLEKWSKEKVISTKEIINIIEKEFGQLIPISKKDSGPAVNYKLMSIKGIIGFINPITSHFCSLCNRIRLTADGKIRLCLFSEKEVDVKKLMRDGIKEKELKEILAKAVLIKPKEIDIDDHLEKHKREMSQIGG